MRRVAATVCCCLAAATSLQCATVPPAPDRGAIARGIADRTGADAGTLEARAAWTVPPGVTLDDGVTPDEAVGVALWNNADFQAALASLGLVRADLVEAGLIRNPILSLLFPAGPKQLEWTVSWPVDTLWQRPKRIAQARLNADAAAEMLVAYGLRLIADVRLAMIDAVIAERRLALAGDQARLAETLARLAESRLRAGDISAFETRLARLDAARLEAVRLTHQGTRDLAVLRVRSLMGLAPESASIILADTLPGADAPCGSLPELIRTSLGARPDVRAAELRIESAGARAGLERTRVLALTAALDANAQGREGFEAGPGVVAELPVFGLNQGGRARASAEVEEASRRYLAVRAAVSAEVAGAVLALRDAEGVARALGDDWTGTSRTAREQAEHLFEAGEISLVTLLEVRQRLIETEHLHLDAAGGLARARVRLEQAVGGPCNPRRDGGKVGR